MNPYDFLGEDFSSQATRRLVDSGDNYHLCTRTYRIVLVEYYKKKYTHKYNGIN